MKKSVKRKFIFSLGICGILLLFCFIYNNNNIKAEKDVIYSITSKNVSEYVNQVEYVTFGFKNDNPEITLDYDKDLTVDVKKYESNVTDYLNELAISSKKAGNYKIKIINKKSNDLIDEIDVNIKNYNITRNSSKDDLYQYRLNQINLKYGVNDNDFMDKLDSENLSKYLKDIDDLKKELFDEDSKKMSNKVWDNLDDARLIRIKKTDKDYSNTDINCITKTADV
ncbi:MAG: hypothetical protein LBT75_00260 [Bacilli bacterium]|jgi:hypothetical protein|nr:hypothetical protein [Bacilli bacterium]